MSSRKVAIARAVVLMFFAVGGIAPMAPLLAGPLRARPGLAAPQTAQPCIEDFNADSDPMMPGFASSGFSHSPSGNFAIVSNSQSPSPDHVLELLAVATDVVTFLGQSVTRAKVEFFTFGPGSVIFEGAGDTLTTFFHPAPLWQSREAADTTLGDNGLPLGQILRVTLIGTETLFDNLEIAPCISAPPSSNVEVLIRPRAINPGRNDGVIKAVILSNASFDARTVDPTTVQLGAATVPLRFFFGDEDEDGDTDLIFFFLARDVGVQCGDTSVRLTGQTTSGQPIEGASPIETLGCP